MSKSTQHTILFDSNLHSFFFQDQSKKFGGVSRIYRIVKGLSRNNKYKILCLTHENVLHENNPHSNIHLVKSRIGKRLGLFDLIRLQVTYKPDVIIDFYATLQIFMLGLLNLVFKQKFIFFVGNDSDVNGLYIKRTNRIYNYLYYFGLKRASLIICQTDDQKRKLRRVYHLDSEVILSPYLRIKKPIKKKREYISWVGRSSNQKNPHIFLRLARRFPDEKFMMVCNFDEKGTKEEEKIKREAERMKNLVFIESVPHYKIDEIFAASKFLVNTSQFEGFPNTFVEAALEETPVISLFVDPNGMLTTYNSGIFCDGSFENMTQACNVLISDPSKRNHYGATARHYAVLYHDIDRAMPKITDSINRTITKE